MFTCELTNEDIVTKLILRNEILKPVKISFKADFENLGDFLINRPAYAYENINDLKYSFIVTSIQAFV